MPVLDRLTPPPLVAVFDAYGTLFDVHSAVARHAAALGGAAGPFSEAWRAKQLEYTWVRSLAGRYRDFEAVTEDALDAAFALHPAVDPGLRGRLLEAYRVLDPYPEVPEVLGRIRGRGIRTAILSNGTAAMLSDAVAAAGLAAQFDGVLSVDGLGVYKPDPRVYATVLEAFGTARRETLFVSSNRWDVAGAAAFGFACVWVNRSGRPDEYGDLPPLASVATLDDLA